MRAAAAIISEKQSFIFEAARHFPNPQPATFTLPPHSPLPFALYTSYQEIKKIKGNQTRQIRREEMESQELNAHYLVAKISQLHIPYIKEKKKKRASNSRECCGDRDGFFSGLFSEFGLL